MQRRYLWLAAALPLAARAQPTFPDRPLRLIVPFAAGTSSDIQGRLVAIRMGETLGQPIVVENRAGGGGTVGAEAVAKARSDGHTLLLGSNGPLTVNPVIQSRMPYDVETELAPVALVSRSPLTLAVKADSPIHSLAALIVAAKAKPGEITIGSSGQGSATHFLIEQLMVAAGIRLTHVPYRGSSQSIPDLIAGNVQVVMGEVSTTVPVWRGGLVRILATTGPSRTPLVPEIGTLIEQGFPGLTGGSWAALMTTGGTPEAAIRVLAAAANAALADASYRERQAEVGAQLSEAAVRSPSGLAAWLREERMRTRATAVQAGIGGE